MNNTYFCPWVALFCECMYIYLIGVQILHVGQSYMTMGLFLTNLNVVKDLGTTYGDIYETLLNMQSTIDSLRHIVWIMNLPTDLEERADASEFRRKFTKEKRAELVKKHPHKTSGLMDLEPLVLSDFTFAYGDNGAQLQMTPKTPNSKGTIEIPQGSVVSVIGPRSQGKATLMKILGGVIIKPESGVFIPAHLRVLHVPTEPYFYNGSLYKNLTFGLAADNPANNRQRVREICMELSVSDRALAYLNEPGEDELEPVERWDVVLSLTDRHLLNLARAFVFDPDVLVVHKPTMPFDERLSSKVLEVMTGWVSERGIKLDPKEKMSRRPTTLIMSSAKIQGVKLADRILRMTRAKGLEEVKNKSSIGSDALE